MKDVATEIALIKDAIKTIDPSIDTDIKFADPTRDDAFKMLFGKEENKKLTISLLNNLLNFVGNEKEIIDLKYENTELKKTSLDNVSGSVDVLCTTRLGKKIAIEMQYKHKGYFISRVQEYMSRLISMQAKKGGSESYHDDIAETYILSIGRQNIFRGKYAVSTGKVDKNYEKTVVPMVKELGIEMPGNKMYWKFYELQRFVSVTKKEKISEHTELKKQWLNFLAKCSQVKEVPDEAAEIIKEGYEIMKMSNWSEAQKLGYWYKMRTKAYEEKEEEKRQAELNELKRKNDALEIANKKLKKVEEEYNKGKAEGEVSKIKSLLEYEIEPEKIFAKMEYLKGESKEEGLNNIQYIKEHMADSDGDILAALWHGHDTESEAEVVSVGEVLEAETGELG